MRPVHALAILLLLLACASSPDNTLVPGNEGAPGVQRFLVCAPNTLIALPAELQDATGALREQVDAYLRFHGRQAQWLDLYESKRLWTAALDAAKAQGSVEQAPAIFAQKAGELHEFDAIVLPSILLHKTRALEGSATWDGVTKRMKVVNAPRLPSGGRNQSTLAEGVAQGGVTGDVLVTSVHVLVYSRAGSRVFEGRGGVSFAQDADLAPLAKKYSWQYRPHDVAGDVDALREGIALAFDPYLPNPEE
jgi:hypothetical protein